MESKYFSVKELECTCGCGTMNIDQGSLRKLDKLRELVNRPVILNRACSCAERNKEVGGSDTSSHIADNLVKKSYAFDIKVDSSRERFEVLAAALLVGFDRIGVAKTFIHVDDDPASDKAREVVWVY